MQYMYFVFVGLVHDISGTWQCSDCLQMFLWFIYLSHILTSVYFVVVFFVFVLISFMYFIVSLIVSAQSSAVQNAVL